MAVIADGGGAPSLPPEEERWEKWLPPTTRLGGPPIGVRPPRRERLPQESWLPSPPKVAPGMPTPEAWAPLAPLQPGPPLGLAGEAYLPAGMHPEELPDERELRLERRKLQLYDLVNLPAMVWERMGGQPALGLKPGAKSLLDDLVENPGDALWKRRGEIIYGAVWKWGAEMMYELSKLPERIIWLEMRAVEEGKPFMPIGLDPGLMTNREAAALWSLVPEADRTITVEKEWGEFEEGAWEDVAGWLQEGEIGYTFVRHPERLEPFRADLAAGMAIKAAVGKYEDFWLELGLNTLIDPGWFIPSKAMRVIWPGGVLAGKAIGYVAGGRLPGLIAPEVPGMAERATSPLRRAVNWLTEYTNRSTVSMRGDAAVDAITELVLRSPVDEDVLDVVNRALTGDLDVGVLGSRTQGALQDLSKQFDGDTFEGVLGRFFPEEIGEAWADETLQPLLRKDPMLLPYLLGEAAESAAAREIGYVPAHRGGVLQRSLDFAGGLLKEQWLSVNPAYVLANSTDNTIKCWLTGHFVNPLDLPAPDKIAGYLADYGTYLPGKVAESMVAEEIGAGAAGRIRRIPIPGVGKPVEIVDFWSGVTRTDLRKTWPWLEAIAPKRPSDLLVRLDLAEPPSRLASVIDNINYASFSETGRDLSGRIEQTARAQLFWDTFKRYIDETARPALLSAARGLGVSDDIISSLSRVKSPVDITGLLPEADVVPIVRLSSLMPEGVDVEALGYAARTLDGMQNDALAKGTPEAVDGLRVYIDDLFDTLGEQARRTTEAADIEEVVTTWRAAQIREAVGTILGRSREVSDALLSQVRAAVIENPDQASSLWPRYFDSKRRISNEVQQEVSRLVKQRTPVMSDVVDSLLGRFEDSTADELAKGMSYTDWGLFGEQLSGLRDLTDEAEDVAWKAFMDGDLTPKRLSALEKVQHELQGIWRATAAEAKVWREGYLAQKGTHKVSGERYQQHMLEIWRDQGFVPVQKLWQEAATKLGAERTFVERAPALVDSAAELAAFRRERGLSDDMVATFRRMQKSDPDAALQWFLEQRGDAQLRLQQDAQAEFVEEMGLEYSEKMRAQADALLDGLDGWQSAIHFRLDDATRARALQAGEREALQANLDTLTKAWAEHLDTASMEGSLETGRVLFDYTRTKRWEAGLGVMFPFTKWQLRNPFIWRDILEKQPGAFSLLTRYADASERERERMGTSARFKGMAPLPGQEWLQQQGVLPEGYWGVDPRALMSAATQIREPFVSPEEEQMGPMAQILHAPERVGMHLWPWLEQAAAAGGWMGAPSWGATGPFERLSPAVRGGVESLQEQFLPGGAPNREWLDRYWVAQTLAAWVSEGKISAEDAAAPTPALLAEAESAQAGIQQGQAITRWLQPFGVKYARPGEMDIRGLREEMRGMPTERAAYLRTLHPELGAYQRALTGVEEPEIADWDAQRDAVNLRYDRMLEGLPPWHPRTSEIQRQRAMELESLEASKPPEEEWEPEEGTLQQLEMGRPKPEAFESEGVIDWDAFNEAEGVYAETIEAAGIEPEAYERYRRRYMSPLELAWEMRQGRQEAGWGEFERLRSAEEGPTPEVPELGRWITSEMQQRMGQGWKAADVVAWAGEQQRLPYDEITRILAEQYGPVPVREMLPEVLAERPWLEGQDYGAEEWGGIDRWLDVEMPGMFTPRTQEALAQREIKDWYYDLMPQQRREMRHRLRLDEEVDFDEWVESDEAQGLAGAPGGPASLEYLYHTLRPPSARERQETELEMVRFQRGAGDWTPRLERYYTDPDSPKSKFWNLRDTLILSNEAYDDPVLSTALIEGNRNTLQFSDAQYQGAFDYLQANQDRFVDREAMALAEAHPDWFREAQEQRPEIQSIEIPEEVSDEYWSLTTGAERTAWQEANPEAWEQLTTVWEKRKVAQIGNPYYTYAYQHDKYEQWFGDVPPGKVDAKKALASFREAEKDMEAFHTDEGEWTAAMDHWYGSDGAKDRWWDAYWAAKPRLNRDAWDDAAITATFDKELQAALPVEALEYLFEEAMTRLSRYFGAPKPKPWEVGRTVEEEAPAPATTPAPAAPPAGPGVPPPPPPPPSFGF